MAGSFDIKFTGDLSELQKALDSFSKDAQKKTKDVEKSFISLNTVIIGVGAALAAVEVAGFLKESIKAASEQEEAINNLNVALASAGQFTKQASQDFQEFASELQKTTKFSDDAVIKSAALLESISRLDEQGLKKATQASLDLSSALSIDLESATRLVGKAAEGNVAAFKKFGVEVRKGSTDAETFANALNVLNTRFGGTAAAQVNTFVGSTARLSNVFNELQEAIGDNIIKNQAVIATINLVSKAFVSLTETIKEFSPQIGTFITSALQTFISAIPTALTITASAFTTVDQIFVSVIDSIRAVHQAIIATTGAVAEFVTGNQDAARAAQEDFDNIQKTRDASKQAFEERTQLLTDLITRGDQLAQQAQDQIASDNAVTQNIIVNRTTLDEDKIAREEAEKAAAEEKLGKEIEALQTRQDLLKQFGDAQAAQEISRNQAKLDILKSQEDANSTRNLNRKKEELKKLKALQDEQVKNIKSSLDVISTLQREKSKELFFIGKAAALATAIIDGIAAVQKALNTPFPLDIILPPIVAAASAANVARIASAQPPALAGGIDSIPGFGSQDNFPAILAPGERVVPAESNKDLTEFLADRGNQQGILENILESIRSLQLTTIVNIGDRNIATVIRDAISDGRVLIP